MGVRLPRLALIPGEPAGIGPELCVRLAQLELAASLIAIADRAVLRRAALRLELPLLVHEDESAAHRPGTLCLRHRAQANVEIPGQLDPDNAASVIAALHEAADGAMRGEFDALVTGPVQKSVINDAGIAYSGTTELLAARAGCDVVMMLASDTLRVALVTTHLPLREVPAAITRAAVERAVRITHAALQSEFGITAPRIAVLGLNPHAGEAGLLGQEEIEVIEPVLTMLRAEGMVLEGPLPADTAFLPARIERNDAVIAMYHDQGLPVLKHAGFERAVNITLGLPFVRVAVDHGTALDLAGTGRADAASLVLAARIATDMAVRRLRRSHG